MSILPKLLIATISTLFLSTAQAADDVMIVYDASGSMWGQIDGVNKIVTAREVMADLVNSWPEDTNLGLIAYGHRSEGSCDDIETMITPQPIDRQEFINKVNAIVPKGKTPISSSLKQAAEVLKYRDNNATIVLISDGLESCHGDPCAVAADLKQNGVSLTTHVVGFDLGQQGNEALSCIAKNTGGLFVPASNASELKEALRQVQAQVTQEKAVPVPTPEPEVAPEPETPEYTMDLTAPEQAITGSRFPVSWSTIISQYDRMTIVPAGAKDGTYGTYFDVSDKLEGSLLAPADPGLYEVRYVLRHGNKTLASTPIEVITTQQTVTAPEHVITGAPFTVSWGANIDRYDRMTIVPAGAKDGTYGMYFDVGDKLEGQLTAPADPGLYEVRYMLRHGNKTLASTPLEVVTTEITLDATKIVRANTNIDIRWSSVINPYDRITIVPAGAKEGSYGTYFDVSDRLEGTLKAPAAPGLYELRYVLRQGNKTITKVSVEVVAESAALDSGVGLQVPTQAKTGETITVSWSQTSDSSDQRIALAKAEAADFTWLSAYKITDNTEQQITLPNEAGRYEVRYLDISSTAVLGRNIIEVR